MPRRKEKTPGADKVRERVVLVIRLIIARKIKGIAYYQDLAEAIRSDRSRVSNWNNGTGHPTVDNLEALVQIFGVSAKYLLKGEGPEFDSEPLKRIAASDKGRKK